MNKEIKTDWLAALRSGDYRQGQLLLRYRPTYKQKDRYCCLGVLCEVIGEEFTLREEELGSNIKHHYEIEGINSSLSENLLDLVGLNHEEEGRLIDMNDGNMTFKEIADHIEKNL